MFVLILMNFFISIKEIEAKEFYCENISDQDWSGSVGNVKNCYMNGTTSIDKPGATISPHDKAVGGLDFSGNKKIFYLPDNVAESFPNLKGYGALGCSLKEISKQNLNGLVKLIFLNLGNNQIEKIASGTFEGLAALETIWLFRNKIKFMNGEAFRSLNKLTEVSLHSNVCIAEDFENPTQIAAMPRTVSEKCKFDEQEETTTAETTTTMTTTIEHQQKRRS